jgi:hypothetical protein
MALSSSYSTRHGIDIPSAYFTVTSARVSKARVSMDGARTWANTYTVEVSIDVFASEDAYRASYRPIESFDLVGAASPDLPIFEEAYRLLKLQPFAAGAADV